jgi:hypothetical protein
MVLEPKPTHLRRSVSWGYKSRYCDRQRRRRRSPMLSFVHTSTSGPYLSLPPCNTERDSPRDKLVVTIFLLTVFGLLLAAGIKSRMLKAGFDTNMSWNSGRRWWEVRGPDCPAHYFPIYPSLQAWNPRRQPDELGLTRFGYSADRDISMGDYIPVSTSAPTR